MPSRIPTDQLPTMQLVCWCIALMLSILELFRGADSVVYPGILVVSFFGTLANLSWFLRKDR